MAYCGSSQKKRHERHGFIVMTVMTVERVEIASLRKWLEKGRGWQFVREIPTQHYGFYHAEFITPQGEIKLAQVHNNWGRIEMHILTKNPPTKGKRRMIIKAKKRRFKRGTILWNAETNRAERIVTITEKTIGTRTAEKDAPIMIHDCVVFKSPTKADIQAFLGNNGRFRKTAMAITDAAETAIALGDKVVVIANSDPRLPRIEAAVKSGNNRSLAQLISQRRTKAEVLKKVRDQLENI